MALTDLQRAVCGVIAANRRGRGESYVAGATALNELIGAARVSRDIDLFHDTEEAVDAAWRADRTALEAASFEVRTARERPGFVEARIGRDGEMVLMQWARDSAFRFFPLIEHDEFGLTLHPFDLATNKVLALVGRLEVRDWIDVIECGRRLQPLGYLAWAACGKDPGFSPGAILEHAARTARYSQAELEELSFSGPAPDAGELSRRWHAMLDEARRGIGNTNALFGSRFTEWGWIQCVIAKLEAVRADRRAMTMRRPKRARLSAAERRELWRRWRQGESLCAIGRALGRFPTTLNKAFVLPIPLRRQRLPDQLGLQPHAHHLRRRGQDRARHGRHAADPSDDAARLASRDHMPDRWSS